MKGNQTEQTIQFAGLTNHANVEMGDRAASIAGLDADNPPELSFSQAIRQLDTASTEDLAWKVPETAASHLDVDEFNEEAPDGIEAVPAGNGSIYIETGRFRGVYCPDKTREWVQGNFRDDDTSEFKDALWHCPTSDYAITNPVPFYEPLGEEIRDEDLGDNMFGEIRTKKSGGEVHMDIMFDAFEVQVEEDTDDFGGAIVLGIQTGYDFFGGTALYAEGFAQDTGCSNSIRSVTEQKSRRHVGEIEDTNEWWGDILEQMDLMTDRLADAIEAAQEINVDYMEMEFSEPFTHDDDLRSFYELSGLPSYLADSAASHVRSRAENQFLPDMWELHSGATYALTHDYRGGEQTGTMNEYVQTANDMLMNPSQSIGTVERSYSQQLARQSDDAESAAELDDHEASAVVAEFRESVEEKRDAFETRQDELEQMLVAPGVGEQETITDGGESQ
jgi:ferredoxin